MRAITRSKRLLIFAIVAVIFAMAVPAMAQAPAATTRIGNQASATYTDASAIQRTSTSNPVYTVVQQVASLTLTANGAKTATVGSQVAYPHTLTNTGNGADAFTLAVGTSGTVIHTATAIYVDANGDGIPDNTTNLAGTAVTVQPGSANSFKFVVVGTVPNGATAGQTGTITVTATSGFDNTKTAANNDVTTVTGNAVMNITKSLSQNYGLPGSGPYTVTFTYTNQGNATAANVRITDALPTYMTYVAGSGRWSVTGATALTDATGDTQGTAPNTITYSGPADGANGTIIAQVTSVAPGASGTITFQVRIAANAVVGVLQNSGVTQYNDGGAGAGNTIDGNTNSVNFMVQQQAGVTISDTNANGDTDGANDIQRLASAPQGGTVLFYNTVTNTGSGSDTFNITVANTSFPAGTVFQLLQSDGVTPLMQDSNGDGTADVMLASGASYTLVVKATLPPGASGNNGGAGYLAVATARSTITGAYVVNPGGSDTVTERLDTIIANAVDVTNNVVDGASAPGHGAGPEGSPVVTNTTNPGTGTTFTLYVNNTGGQSDTYDLTTTAALPAGWTVVFRSSTGTDCSTLGGPITNTGVVNAGAAKLVCAVVSIPNNYPAGNVDINFRAQSPSTFTVDVIHDRVTVNTYASITITPPQAGVVYPNGTVVYKHTLTNGGNTNENVTLTTSDSLSGAGWGSVFYDDSGTSAGTFDAGDKQITAAVAINAGSTATVYIKVTAPSGAAIGAVDATTGSGAYSAGTATVRDNTTVIAGDLRLVKEQALDANCTGGAVAWTQTDVDAAPGACVRYRITATNQGTADVTSVVISDATPAFTTYIATPAASCTGPGACAVTAPSAGASGTVSANAGTLKPSESAVVIFAVKIASGPAN